MRLLIHDYAGHPFQVQLSRTLAGRGHRVTHVYASMIETPRGALERRDDDPSSFDVFGLGIAEPFRKHSFVRRRFQEIEYGRRLGDLVSQMRPDWVVSGNTPSEPQAHVLARCEALGIRFASWVQDFYGTAVDKLLRKRLPVVGAAIGAYYKRLDRRVLERSDGVVLITEDFRSFTDALGVYGERMHVIENWAPLDELPLRPRVNAWAKAHGLADRFCFLYSGTLGMKHDPGLLLSLAERFRDDDRVRVVVVTEGPAAEWLKARAAASGLMNLIVLPFQPYARMPEVLASGDVLVSILEPEAGVFSVPSKVLTYLCAGRPLLAAMPPENLASRIVDRIGAGTVVAPRDAAALCDAAARLYDDPQARAEAGRNSRAYAERTFDVERIADRFEAMLGVRPARRAHAPLREVARAAAAR